ncbi:ABC transporter permease [Candidatus Trichorickettsia mobilis]|uniref:ABC transporter permease n=1 Tax=Candidatus Trichorickettsia mobilis TaxID=1346319 RepID=A0ABZ0UTW4_9RICK|nr:ABC transporter permease [Candidatus Trichorickettsia mobilis]WPY00941.1 ABC transporter permease [Candidatus Trichorickettsia mobilis]
MLIIIGQIGKCAIEIIRKIGAFSLLIVSIIRSITKPPFYLRLIYRQFLVIGFYSLPVVAMTAFFSGAVLALQSYTGFSRFSAENSIATVVILSITRELGPVLAGLMVAGRVGASIAAEIATMRVTEQIDALYTLSTDPMKYLILPRVSAAVIMLPCLVFIGDIIGVLGGYCVSVYKLDFNSTRYITSSFNYLETMDVVSGLVKAAVFGFIIAVVSCYSGYFSDKGARGVGNATTKAVVNSSILILISNYLITELFF